MGSSSITRTEAPSTRLGSREDAVRWARSLLRQGDFVVLDSETTGLGNPIDFVEVYPDLLDALWAKRVIVYNASYDRRVWDAAVRRLGARAALAGELAPWECAMRAFAAYVGERSKRGGYKNQKLVGGDHTALGDARATLRLIERMAEGA
jgi:hypothetical protein